MGRRHYLLTALFSCLRHVLGTSIIARHPINCNWYYRHGCVLVPIVDVTTSLLKVGGTCYVVWTNIVVAGCGISIYIVVYHLLPPNSGYGLLIMKKIQPVYTIIYSICKHQ